MLADAIYVPQSRTISAAGVPAITAYRATLGFALAAFFVVSATAQTGPVPSELQVGYSPLARHATVKAMAASGIACAIVRWLGAGAALAFALGFKPRLMWAATVLCVAATSLVVLQARGVHDMGLPLTVFAGLLVVPWPARGDRPYAKLPAGLWFALWWPGLAIGLAFASAGLTKLRVSGVEWITSGAVRYHFVEDGLGAFTPWGGTIASVEWLAMAFSLGAVAIEIGFVLNVFARSPRVRLAYGVAGAALLAGFAAFQGVVWPLWWVGLLAFLPYQLFDRRTEPWRIVPAFTRSQRAVVATFLLAQTTASLKAFELEPVISYYPMYASTFASPEVFERHLHPNRMTRFRFLSAGADVTRRIASVPGARGVVLAELLAENADGCHERQARLQAMATEYARRFGEPLGDLTVRRDRYRFDWAAGRFVQVGELAERRIPVQASCGSF